MLAGCWGWTIQKPVCVWERVNWFKTGLVKAGEGDSFLIQRLPFFLQEKGCWRFKNVQPVYKMRGDESMCVVCLCSVLDADIWNLDWAGREAVCVRSTGALQERGNVGWDECLHASDAAEATAELSAVCGCKLTSSSGTFVCEQNVNVDLCHSGDRLTAWNRLQGRFSLIGITALKSSLNMSHKPNQRFTKERI